MNNNRRSINNTSRPRRTLLSANVQAMPRVGRNSTRDASVGHRSIDAHQRRRAAAYARTAGNAAGAAHRTERPQITNEEAAESNLMARIWSWVPVVALGGVVEKYFKTKKIRIVAKENRDEAPTHPISAAVRAILTIRAIGHLMRNRKNPLQVFRLVSLFGAMRDLKLLSKIDHKKEIDLTVYRPIITAKDTSRIEEEFRPNIVQHVQEIKTLPHAFLLVDVYVIPRDLVLSEDMSSVPFNPQSLHSFLMRAHMKGLNIMSWVGNLFKGDAGTIHGEGGWYRHPETGLIHSRPDINSEIYPPHDPCDWIWKNTVYRPSLDVPALTWSVVQHLGDMVIVTFSMVDENVIGETTIDTVVKYKWVKIPVIRHDGWLGTVNRCLCYLSSCPIAVVSETSQKLLNWVAHFDSENVLVHQRIYNEVIQKIEVKHYTQLSLRTLVYDLQCKLNADEENQLLKQLFPTQFKPPITEMALMILKENAEAAKYVDTFNILNGELLGGYSRSLDDLNSTFSSASRKQNNLPLWLLGIGGAVTGLYLASRSMRASIFNTNALYDCIFVPVVEEVIKRIPYLGKTAIIMEFIMYMFDRTGLIDPPLVFLLKRIMVVCFHFLWLRLPLTHAIVIHGIWNFVCAVNSQAKFPKVLLFFLLVLYFINRIFSTHMNPYALFRERSYNTMWEERSAEGSDVRVSSFNLSESTVSRQHVFASSRGSCSILKLQNPILPEMTENKSNPVWTFLPVNVPLYVPMKTDRILYDTVNLRILAPPPCDPIIQQQGWQYCDNLFGVALLSKFPLCESIHGDLLIDEWLDHFDESKVKKKYEAELNRAKIHGYMASDEWKKTTLFVKSDEALVTPLKMKTRAIANVHPAVQVFVGPVLYEAQKRFKEFCSMTPEPFLYQGIHFYFSYAGSSTDSDLSNWWEYVQNVSLYPACFIIVSGDDSIVVYRNLQGEEIIEGDASMFDQSQSFGPLELEYRVLAHLGVGVDVIEILRKLTLNKYKLFTKEPSNRNYIDKTNRPMRDSGGSDTSLGNSIVNLQAWVYVILSRETLNKSIHDTFLILGLEMKLKIHRNWDNVSFLKGLWYPTYSGRFWAPLPSRILKIGKSLKDPRVTYKDPSLYSAAERCLNDLACCYSFYAQVPILRVFVTNFMKGKCTNENMLSKYQIASSKDSKPPLYNPISILSARYDVPESWFVDVELMFPNRPFMFFEHPLFATFARVDYG